MASRDPWPALVTITENFRAREIFPSAPSRCAAYLYATARVALSGEQLREPLCPVRMDGRLVHVLADPIVEHVEPARSLAGLVREASVRRRRASRSFAGSHGRVGPSASIRPPGRASIAASGATLSTSVHCKSSRTITTGATF